MIDPLVLDRHAAGSLILTRRPGARLAEGQVTHIERTSIDLELAQQQHEHYRAALAAAGGHVIDLAPDDERPDSTFVEDALIALPECFILTRPGAPSRRDEPERLSRHVPADRPLIRLQAPATLDGGDVLRIGRTLFVGLTTRTNEAGIDALRYALGAWTYAVVPVPVTGSLHLKTAVTALADDLILANTAWVDLSPLQPTRIIPVDPREPFAGNSLRIGDRILMQAAHPRTSDLVREAGFDVHRVDISEFAKMEAGLTCLSVIIPDVA